MLIHLILKSAALSGLVASAVFVSSCTFLEKRKSLDVQDVDSVVIHCRFPDDTLVRGPRFLSAVAFHKFLDDLNGAPSDGSYKFYPFFKITVYQKDRTQRHFRANGSHIKENTDECFKMPGEQYFEDLWNAAKK
jgi:hypothetical protein